MNTYYYKKNSAGELERVVPPIKVNGKWVLHPTAAQYALIAAAYPRNDSAPAPTPPEGMIAEPDGWKVENNAWVRAWKFVPAPAPTPTGRTFSKLKLYAALENAGLWLAFEAWLKVQTINGMNAFTAFSLAQDLSDAHPMFGPLLEACKAALGISDSQAEVILNAAEV